MKILLAIDGSANSLHAAEFLCRLPHDDALDIEVFTAVNAPDVSTSTSTKAWLPAYMEQLHAAADEGYANVCACFEGASARLNQHKASGHTGSVIADRATEIGAELIVIGAKGHSAIARVLLGSVSDFVGRHSSIGVLTVRPPFEHAPSDGRLRVTVAFDDSAPSHRAIEKFQQFSWRGNVDVQLLTVVHVFPQFPGEGEALLHEQAKEDLARAHAAIESPLALLKASGVNATAKVVTGDHAGVTIVDEANAHHSDLIVIGNTGRSFIPRLLLGSVSAYVQRHAPQSVWIAK